MAKRLLCLLAGGGLLAVLVGCAGRAAHSAAPQQRSEADQAAEAEAAVPVHAQPVERRTLAEVVYGLGKSEAQPRNVASLTPAVEGKVVQIRANQGDAVKQGQVIVELDKSVAAAALAEKQAARDEVEASLRLLEAPPRPEDQRVHLLAIEEAKVAVAKAQANVDRLRPLRERNEIPESQMFEAESALQQARLQQQTAEAEMRLHDLPPRDEAIAQGKAQIASAEAVVASAQAQLDLLSIRSPIDGVLDSLTCRLGQTLAAGSPIGEVVDSRRLNVVVWLPVAKIQAVRLGQTARIVREVAEGDAGKAEASGETPPGLAEPVAGQVTFIGRVADPQTGNLPVRIAVDNAKGRLVLGQVVGAEITVAEKKDVLAVPAEAIEDLGEGPVLNVIRDGKSVALHPRLGMRGRQWVEVLDTDLKTGEPVIVEGGYNLPEGTEVATESKKEAGAEPKQENKSEAERPAEKSRPEKAKGRAKP